MDGITTEAIQAMAAAVTTAQGEQFNLGQRALGLLLVVGGIGAVCWPVLKWIFRGAVLMAALKTLFRR